MDKAQQIESLMYSYDDWDKVAHGKVPGYCFEIEKGNQILFYFGANHSHDIKNPQYEKIRAYWTKFLEKIKGYNAIVFVEGGTRTLHKSEKIAIHRESEAGFITVLAHRANILTHSPEPDRRAEKDALIKEFSKEEVQYYYFARVVYQWIGIPNPKRDFKEYIKGFLQRDREDSGWLGFDFSFENMKNIHKNIFGTDFNENDKDFFYSIVNPTTEKSVVNKVARASSIFRNIHIVMQIEEFWKWGKNIFVIFGGAHPVLQEPALRKLLN